jgi:DNA repair exonuclease SbcCD ATPase subunit
MSKKPDEKNPKSDRDTVVDKMFAELGIDDAMKKDLVESGRMTKDVLRVESADQVRRRIEMDKSIGRFRESTRNVEKNLNLINDGIDHIERDLIPVVLSFLVGLKGNLVNLRSTIIGKSKRRAKTNLQAVYFKTEVTPIIEEEFAAIEETLTSGMSAPILEKIRVLTDTLKDAANETHDELTTLKASIDDFTQRLSTEVEFLSTELTMKPKVAIPKEVAEQLKALSRHVKEELAGMKARNESLEETVNSLRAVPAAGAETVAELRKHIKSMETLHDLLNERLEKASQELQATQIESRQLRDAKNKNDLLIEDLGGNIRHLEDELKKANERLAGVDELRARLRSYESGESARELERVKTELDRISASHERTTSDYKATHVKLQLTEEALRGYLGLMDRTEKTKAFLMVEDNLEMPIREIARSLGVAPAIVKQWAEDFHQLGIAKIVDGEKLVLTREKIDLS